MSTCARCGLSADAGDLTVSGVCPGGAAEQLECARRELANLRSLLRSVTGKLEDALEELGQDEHPNVRASRLIDSALEAIS